MGPELSDRHRRNGRAKNRLKTFVFSRGILRASGATHATRHMHTLSNVQHPHRTCTSHSSGSSRGQRAAVRRATEACAAGPWTRAPPRPRPLRPPPPPLPLLLLLLLLLLPLLACRAASRARRARADDHRHASRHAARPARQALGPVRRCGRRGRGRCVHRRRRCRCWCCCWCCCCRSPCMPRGEPCSTCTSRRPPAHVAARGGRLGGVRIGRKTRGKSAHKQKAAQTRGNEGALGRKSGSYRQVG